MLFCLGKYFVFTFRWPAWTDVHPPKVIHGFLSSFSYDSPLPCQLYFVSRMVTNSITWLPHSHVTSSPSKRPELYLALWSYQKAASYKTKLFVGPGIHKNRALIGGRETRHISLEGPKHNVSSRSFLSRLCWYGCAQETASDLYWLVWR